MTSIPFTAVGANELGDDLEDTVRCPKCGKSHPLEYGTSRRLLPDNTWTESKPDKSMAFYHCGDRLYMAGVGGKYLPGLEQS